MGKKPRGRCALKYATAISPHAMKAAHDVNNPTSIKDPQIVSMIPAIIGVICSPRTVKKTKFRGIGRPPNAPRSHFNPWLRYRKANTMRINE